jgi:hypothetical protein
MVYFQTKKNNLVNFEVLQNGKCWYIYANLEYVKAIWYT